MTRKRCLWSLSILILFLVLPLMSVLTSSDAAAQAAASAEPARGKPALAVRGKFIDQLIAEFMEKHGVPGLAMAIVQAPYIPRSAGYGRTSLTDDELASTRTMWNIGPLTQAFTAVAIFQLHEAGKLGLRDAIGKHLPNLPAAWAKVTVFELLQHASGIADYRANPRFLTDQPYTPAELVALAADQPPLFAAGTEVRLSATNFLLLGLIVERAGGLSYRDFITRHQIEPLGLGATMFPEDFATKSFLDRPHKRFTSEIPYINPVEPATGTRIVEGSLAAVPSSTSQNLVGFGNLWSSAEDISAWDIALAGSILIKSPENRALLYKPTTLANGTVVPAMAGWQFTRHPGFMEIKGSSPGFSAYLSRFTAPDDLVCVTLLVNRQGVDLTGLARDIAAAYKAGLGAGLSSDAVVARESKFSVDETVARLQKLLAARKIPVFATFDHAENARQAGLPLGPSKVVVFGNPAVGTKLMQANPAAALDLPLRLAVWEDSRGRVWASYHSLEGLAAEYGIKDTATVAAMAQGLEGLVARTVDVYAD
ncbi:MAG: serine hydrolase [Reyranella sp.]|nr:serine hydrolase [Reyranella sp.]